MPLMRLACPPAHLVAVAAVMLCFLLAVTACEKTGIRQTGRVGRDAGPPPMAFAYTPEGCDYSVKVPEISESGMSVDARGEDPTPKFIHASWAGPAESTFAVNWRTDLMTTTTELLVGTEEAAVDTADGPTDGVRRVLGHHMLFMTITGEQARFHEAHVCGLEADSRYYYKVGGSGAWSEVFDVGTAPAAHSTQAFRFAVTGDARNDAVVWAQTQGEVFRHAPDFELFTGDAVALGVVQEQWDEFFGTDYEGTSVQDVLARTQFMPVSGNHDALALNYLLQFALPQDESEGERVQGEEWYSFDYANAHFVMLHDFAGEEILNGAERDFLEADLAAVDREKTPWVFAVHHHSPYSCSNHGSIRRVREAFQPLYDRYRVDIVLTGHDHNYERSKPIRGFEEGEGIVAASGPRGVPIDGSGTIYVVTAGSGAPLYGSDTSCYHTLVAESVNNYVIVDIEDRTLHLTAYRLDGTVIDEFEYSK